MTMQFMDMLVGLKAWFLQPGEVSRAILAAPPMKYCTWDAASSMIDTEKLQQASMKLTTRWIIYLLLAYKFYSLIYARDVFS